MSTGRGVGEAGLRAGVVGKAALPPDAKRAYGGGALTDFGGAKGGLSRGP